MFGSSRHVFLFCIPYSYVRSRVVLACHVFPFLCLSLCFVIGSLSCVSVFAFVSLFCDWLSSCVLSASSHMFYSMSGVCLRGQLPLSFIMFHCHMFCFALVSSSIFVSPHFSRAHCTHSVHCLILSHYYFSEPVLASSPGGGEVKRKPCQEPPS